MRRVDKIINDPEYKALLNNYWNYGINWWKPVDVQLLKIKNDSWFNIKKSEDTTDNLRFNLDTKKVTNFEPIKSIKIALFPNREQKSILLKWMDTYIDMQNEVNRFSKNLLFRKKKLILNWRDLRDTHLKNIKNKIKNKTNINAHCLDKAIKEMCGKYKSAISNLGNTKFRMRYIKKTKKVKTIKFEKISIAKDKKSFCPAVFGKIFETNDNYLTNVSSDFTIQYNYNSDRFFLYYVTDVTVKVSKKNKQIGLDPGIRTFLTGYSNNHCLKIGDNLYDTIKGHIKKINEINKTELKPSIKKKIERKHYSKITNKVDDLHWKTIKYLTDNYKDISLGNMSTKQICSGFLNPYVKRVGTSMRLYVFKERLKYKCFVCGVNYQEVNERHTSRYCSNCGNGYNFRLTTEKEYGCRTCKIKIDRDINGAKNITIKGTK